MISFIRNSFGPVVVTILLLTTLGGAAYALTVTGRNIKNGSVTHRDIRDNNLTGEDIRDGSLSEADLAFTAPAGPRAIGRTDAHGDQLLPPGGEFVGLSSLQAAGTWADAFGVVSVTISYQAGSSGDSPALFAARSLLNGNVVTPEYSESIAPGESGVLSFQTVVDLQSLVGQRPTIAVQSRAEGVSVLIRSVSFHLEGLDRLP